MARMGIRAHGMEFIPKFVHFLKPPFLRRDAHHRKFKQQHDYGRPFLGHARKKLPRPVKPIIT